MILHQGRRKRYSTEPQMVGKHGSFKTVLGAGNQLTSCAKGYPSDREMDSGFGGGGDGCQMQR